MVNPPDAMNPRTWRWTAVALAAALVVGGLYAAPTPAGAADAPDGSDESIQGTEENLTRRMWRDWNFTGVAGSTTIRSTNATVFDIAFPVTEDVDYESVRFNVSGVFNETQSRSDRDQMWIQVYAGARMDNPDPHGIGFHLAGLVWRDNYDQVHETRIEAAGNRIVEESYENPGCSLGRTQCVYNGTFWITQEEFNGWEWLRWIRSTADRWDWDRPVMHMVVLVGGFKPDAMRLEASWNDTIVGVSTAQFDETFTYFRDDFSSTAHASHETGTSVSGLVQADATLEARLGPSDKSLIFLFIPWPVISYTSVTGGQTGFDRPDGVTREGHRFFFEQSNVTGDYRFWYTHAVSDRPDEAVLMGTSLDWYRFPGESELPWVLRDEP